MDEEIKSEYSDLQVSNDRTPTVDSFGKQEFIINKDGFYISHLIVESDKTEQYQVIFTAYRPCEVVAAIETHADAGTHAGTVTLNLEKLTTGQALDAGETILVNGFNLKGTINTPVIKEGRDLVMTTARQFQRGDRLALKDTGNLVGSHYMCVTVYFKFLGKGQYR